VVRAPSPNARRRAPLALGFLVLGWVLVMQSLGWAQTSYLALIKSLSDGTPRIDRYHWETRDKSWTGGHFYSVKAPGLPFVLLPLYSGLEAAGAQKAATWAADTAHRHGDSRWHYAGLPAHSYGFSEARAVRIRRSLEIQTPLVWVLGLVGTVLPATAILLLVRRRADRLVPGYGALAAVLLGSGTLVMPFATQLFGHALAALLAFLAFLVLWREREGVPRAGLVAVAGLLGGLAVTVEYPLALAGAILGVYAITRTRAPGAVLRRGAAYAAGVLAGLVPLAIYNLWAFGELRHNSYEGAVAISGHTGHARVGLNDGGFFGITWPRPGQAAELLLSARGLLVLTPVVACGVAGIVLLHRRGRRAEAWTIAAIAAGYLAYNAGYWTPFGGGSPGARFLVPVLPFLAVPLAFALRARPAVVLALGIPSALVMLTATLTYPLIGDAMGAGTWAGYVGRGLFSNTLFSAVGLGNGWIAALPVALCVVGALALAVAAAPPLAVRADLPWALAALLAWLAIAATTPALWDRPAAVTGDTGALAVFATSAGLTVVALAALALAERPLGARAPASARAQPVDGQPAADLAG
jgi:uncharacterized membrane protein YhaH (DUF805 family)